MARAAEFGLAGVVEEGPAHQQQCGYEAEHNERKAPLEHHPLAPLPAAKPQDIVFDLTSLRCRRSIVSYLYSAALACILGSVLLRRL